MEIKDLAGLSKPLNTLIKVTAKGMGTLYKDFYQTPKQIKLLNDNPNLILEFTPEGMRATRKDTENDLQNLNPFLQKAIEQEVSKTINSLHAVKFAYHELQEETSEDADMPDDDWINKWFRYTEDISSEKMQTLWGKVLAGEIKKPGSYSLRTMNLLQNLTALEAKKLQNILQYAINGRSILKNNLTENILNFEDSHWLIEIGVLSPLLETVTIFDNRDIDFRIGDLLLSASPNQRPDDKKEFRMPCFLLTNLGKELTTIIDCTLSLAEKIKYLELASEAIKNHTPQGFFNFSIKEILIEANKQYKTKKIIKNF